MSPPLFYMACSGETVCCSYRKRQPWLYEPGLPCPASGALPELSPFLCFWEPGPQTRLQRLSGTLLSLTPQAASLPSLLHAAPAATGRAVYSA